MVRAGRSRRAFLLQHRELFFNGIRHPLLTGSAIMIDQKVTRNPGQPGAEGAFHRPECLDGFKYTQKYFLRQVLSFVSAAREPVAEPVYLPGVKPNQIFPGGFIAAQTSRYEAMVLAQAMPYQIAAPADTHRLVCSPAAGDLNTRML
jgi:hypothetical protein